MLSPFAIFVILALASRGLSDVDNSGDFASLCVRNDGRSAAVCPADYDEAIFAVRMIGIGKVDGQRVPEDTRGLGEAKIMLVEIRPIFLWVTFEPRLKAHLPTSQRVIQSLTGAQLYQRVDEETSDSLLSPV
jgi:hypothetical protein